MTNLTIANVKCKFCSQGVPYEKSVHAAGRVFCSEFCIDMFNEKNS